jgi:hypothetical protein
VSERKQVARRYFFVDGSARSINYPEVTLMGGFSGGGSEDCREHSLIVVSLPHFAMCDDVPDFPDM